MLRLRLHHQLVPPPLGRGLAPSALALDLLAVRMQVENPLPVVDADLVGRLRDRQRLGRLEEAAHGAHAAAAVGGLVSPADAPAAEAAPAAHPSAAAAEAAAPAAHATAAAAVAAGRAVAA